MSFDSSSPTEAPASTEVENERVPVKSVVLATAGNFVEYFDWSVYAAFSIYFAPQFFPSSDPLASTLSAFAVFAVGFVMRPIGGWLLGIYSDRAGKRKGLTLTVSLMALGSLLVAVLPTYAQIGVAAAVVLTIARLVQGIALGGEFGAAVSYLSEIVPSKRRAYYGSYQYMTIAAGVLAANLLGFGLTHLLSESQLNAWGWRIPFIIGAALGIIVFFLRRDQAVPNSGTEVRADPEKSTLRYLFAHNPRAVFRIVLLSMAGTLIYYIWATFLQVYAVDVHGMDPQAAFTASACALALLVVIQPIYGAMIDKVGRRGPLIFYAFAFAIVLVPLLSMVGSNPWGLFAAMAIGFLIFGCFSGSSAAVKAEQFPDHNRGLGISLPYSISTSLFGGTAPYLLTLFTKMGAPWIFWTYVIVLLVVSGIGFIFLKETKGIPLSSITDER